MFGGHRRVGHVALPVAGRRQFAAQAVVAFEEQDVLHPALRQAQRAEHTGRAAATMIAAYSFIMPSLAYCTNIVPHGAPSCQSFGAGWILQAGCPSPGGTHPAERGARCRAGRTRRTESPPPGGTSSARRPSKDAPLRHGAKRRRAIGRERESRAQGCTDRLTFGAFCITISTIEPRA